MLILCGRAQTHTQVKPRDIVAINCETSFVLVMEPDDLKKVEACEGRCDDVMDALSRVVQNSSIGGVFSFASVRELRVAVRKRILQAHGPRGALVGEEKHPRFHPVVADFSLVAAAAGGSAELHARLSSLARETELRVAAQSLWCVQKNSQAALARLMEAWFGMSRSCAQCAESFKVSGTTDRERSMNVVKSRKATWLVCNASLFPRACNDVGCVWRWW